MMLKNGRFVLCALALASLPGHGVASGISLNKCFDDAGRVTYSNQACLPGQRVQQVTVSDPAPPSTDPPPRSPASRSGIPPRHTATDRDTQPRVELKSTSGTARAAMNQARRCQTLQDRQSMVLDTMDAARRNGYTLKQMEVWKREIDQIERQKTQAGCA